MKQSEIIKDLEKRINSLEKKEGLHRRFLESVKEKLLNDMMKEAEELLIKKERPENLKDRTQKEINEIYDMIQDEITDVMYRIQKKTGYYTTSQFNVFADEPKKCIDVELDICLLERPHAEKIDKAEYYAKANPDNVIDKPIVAHQHNSWYMIWDGVHRTEANKLLGNKTIKAKIIIPNIKDK